MINATDLKNGITFTMDGKPYKVVKYAHQKIARGGGTVKLSLRNLENGNLEEKTVNSSVKVNEISTLKRPLRYLYDDGSNAVFINEKSYEQIEIPKIVIKDELPFIKESDSVDVLFWEERPLSVDIPPKVKLEVTETAPGVKGNSATNIYKQARLENDLSIKVPLFIETGDSVVVDTRTGEYVERAK
jgi:elongation factor P